MKSLYPRIRQWNLSRQIFDKGLEALSREGMEGSEGIVFWLGRRHDGIADITHLVTVPRSKFIHTFVSLTVPPETINAITDICVNEAVAIIGQAHTHPPGYPTDLSVSDRLGGFTIPYFLSVVVPDFAQTKIDSIFGCGVHVYYPKIGYKRLSYKEVLNSIRYSDDVSFMVVNLGMID